MCRFYSFAVPCLIGCPCRFIFLRRLCLNYSYCHGAHKGSELPRSFTKAKGSGRIVTIEMKLFNLVLVICHFCWQICQHSIVKIAFNFAKAVLGCLIIRQMWLPRNFVCTFAKACQGHALILLDWKGCFPSQIYHIWMLDPNLLFKK